MASFRRWITVWNSQAEELSTNVVELRARAAEKDSYRRKRRVARGTPESMVIPVVVATPAGNPTGVERKQQQQRLITQQLLSRSYWTRKRRAGYFKFMQEPTPFIQTGIKPTIRWNAVIAERDATRRAARIRGTANELGFNYAWLKVGDPFGYILQEIQRHMLEIRADMGKTWFDPFWTTDEVLDWLEARTNQFLVATGADRTQTILPAEAEITIPNMNDLRRAIYFDKDGNSTPLEIGDTHAKDMASPGWGAAPQGTPDTIIVWGQGTTARLTPPPPFPPNNGTVLLDYVPRFTAREDERQRGDWWLRRGPQIMTPDNIDITLWPGVRKPLPIPNIFYPYIKYGVMADMLGKEGEAQDTARAAYCENRFQEGIELAKMMLGRK